MQDPSRLAAQNATKIAQAQRAAVRKRPCLPTRIIRGHHF
jgi:hypothetical protein